MAFCDTDVTPSMIVIFMPVRAPANANASRCSVLSGSAIAKTF
jgi:hypothetical protein